MDIAQKTVYSMSQSGVFTQAVQKYLTSLLHTDVLTSQSADTDGFALGSVFDAYAFGASNGGYTLFLHAKCMYTTVNI